MKIPFAASLVAVDLAQYLDMEYNVLSKREEDEEPMDCKMYGELTLISGTANRPLAEEIAWYLGKRLVEAEIIVFPNENIFVRLKESVRGKDVFLIEPISRPVNDHIMELLIMIDAIRRDSAGRITAVIPYYAYGRTDKKDQPRVPITARLLADMITVAGADRVLTMDLHAGQIQGFFTIPTDELHARYILSEYYRKHPIPDLVVAAPDIGASKRARNFAVTLGTPLAIIEKRRALDGSNTKIFNLIGEVEGKNVLIVDDEVDTAGTLTNAAKYLQEKGAKNIYACVTHAVLSEPAPDRIRESPIKEILFTNTLPIPEDKMRRMGGKVKILSVADQFGEVIRRIHEGISVGALFNE